MVASSDDELINNYNNAWINHIDRCKQLEFVEFQIDRCNPLEFAEMEFSNRSLRLEFMELQFTNSF